VHPIITEAADESNNTTAGQVTVVVPHDKGKGNGR
jgi:hypothetical protein